MNATLQCFCQILEFASFFKYNKHVRNVSNKYQQNSLKCLTSSSPPASLSYGNHP